MKTFNLPRNILVSFLIFCCYSHVHSQTSNISGIINSYTPVTNITSQSCSSTVTVNDASTFHMGDTVLIMQMKGSRIDTSNTSNFGTVTDLHYAGQYEYATVNHISSNVVYLNQVLTNTYDIAGHVQMIYIPNYDNVLVNATLTAKKWDGTTGVFWHFSPEGVSSSMLT